MKKCIESQNGVTLIVLITTVIVMLIIASITVNYGLNSVDTAKDSVIESNLRMVQQKALEEYATKSVNGETNSYLGDALSYDELKKIIGSDNIALEKGTTKAAYEAKKPYYLLSSEFLQNLGVNASENQKYLLDYESGEIWDVTNRKYEDGETYAYLSGINNTLSSQNEAYKDALITVSLADQLRYENNKYILKIRVKDEQAKIDNNSWGRDDILNGRTIIETSTGIKVTSANIESFTQSEVSSTSAKEGEYIYTITIPKGVFGSLSNIELIITVNENSIIDRNNDTNTKTILKTSYVHPVGSSAMVWSLSAPKYSTKDGIHSNGYTDASNVVWGTEATVDLKLSSGTGLKHNQYVFKYYWSADGSQPSNFNDVADEILLYPNEGDSEVTATIYVNQGTGKGKLYVKPASNYSGLNEVSFKSASINLDNTPPTSQEKQLSSLGFWGLYNRDAFKEFGENYISLKGIYNLRYIDNETGIRKLKEENGRALLLRDEISKVEIDEDSIAEVFSSSGSENLQKDVNTQLTSHKTYLDSNPWIYPGNIDSDYYYIYRLENAEINSARTEKIELSDNVGNKIELPIKQGPFNIDAVQPQISTVYIDKDANVGKIVLTDDYSGVYANSDNLKKIKYKWVKESDYTSTYCHEQNVKYCINNPNSQKNELTVVNTDSNHVSYSGTNQFGNNNNVVITVDPPSGDGNFYLYAYAADFKDISGNPVISDGVRGTSASDFRNEKTNDVDEAGKISEGTLGYVSDLRIDVSEPNGISYPSALNIKVSSTSGGRFGIKRLYIEYKGTTMFQDVLENIENSESNYYVSGKLPDKSPYNGRNVTWEVSDLLELGNGTDVYAELERRIIKNGSHTFISSSIVNGPIVVHLIDLKGNEFTKEYTVQKVQSTELVLNVENGKEYAWPFSEEDNLYTKITSNIAYLDWGDGKSGYYIETNKNYTTNSLWLLTNGTDAKNNKYRSPSSNPSKTFKISGAFTWNWNSRNDVPADQMRKAIKEIKQFGIHSLGNFEVFKNSATYNTLRITNDGDMAWVKDEYQLGFNGSGMYNGCENLTKLPSATTLNKNAFKTYWSLSHAFRGTEISSFDVGLLASASNIEFYDYTFANCASLSSIDKNIFQYGKKELVGLKSTFENSGLTSISPDLLKNLKVGSFEDTFAGTKIKYIPTELFSYYSGVTKFKGTFKNIETLSNSSSSPNVSGKEVIPVNLFKNQSKVESYENLFEECNNISYVPENLFKDSPGAYEFTNTFKNTSLADISANLFISQRNNNKDMNFVSTFMGTDITGIKNDLFKDLKVKSFSRAFQNCYKLEQINSATFANMKKTSLTSINNMFDSCGTQSGTGQLKISGNLFENCSSLKNAADVFRVANVKRVDNEIFKNCSKIEDIQGMFYSTPVTYVNPALFDYCSSSIKKVSGKIQYTDNSGTHIFYDGAFRGCVNLTDCPNLWNRTKFPNIQIDLPNVMVFYGSSSTIKNKITDSNIKAKWCNTNYDT